MAHLCPLARLFALEARAEHGGLLCDFDRRWRPCRPHDKLLEFQARQTWIAAEAAVEFRAMIASRQRRATASSAWKECRTRTSADGSIATVAARKCWRATQALVGKPISLRRVSTHTAVSKLAPISIGAFP